MHGLKPLDSLCSLPPYSFNLAQANHVTPSGHQNLDDQRCWSSLQSKHDQYGTWTNFCAESNIPLDKCSGGYSACENFRGPRPITSSLATLVTERAMCSKHLQVTGFGMPLQKESVGPYTPSQCARNFHGPSPVGRNHSPAVKRKKKHQPKKTVARLAKANKLIIIIIIRIILSQGQLSRLWSVRPPVSLYFSLS